MATKNTTSRAPSIKRQPKLQQQQQKQLQKQQPAALPKNKPVPPPVPRKPTLQERQHRHALHGGMARSDSLPPPIGYNDADRFYLTSPTLPPEATDWPNTNHIGDADSLGHVAADNLLMLDEDYDENDPEGHTGGYPDRSRHMAERPFESSHVGTSPWLDRQLRQSSARQPAPLVRRHAQTDTRDLDRDRDRRQRRLEEQVSDLRAENRVKERELEANRYIEQQMNRKLKTTDEAFALRHAIKDKERIIDGQEKVISEQTSEVGRLTELSADRERLVMQLQSEVDNLERVLAAQRALREGERLQSVSEELDRVKDELATAGLETDALRNELRNLQGTLSRKEREVKSKEDRLSQLANELASANQTIGGLRNELTVAESHAKAAEREAKLLREQNQQLSDVRERCRNLQDEKAYMAEAVRTLEGKVAQLEAVKKDKEVLDGLVADLKSALKDKNQVLKERRDLLTQTQQLRDRMKDTLADEAGMQRELSRLQEVLGELEKENQFYRDLDNDFRRLKQRYEEVDKALRADEVALAKLRPRLERLQDRCKEKDDLIRRLANELRSGGDRLPRELLQEADRNQGLFVEDYVDPMELTGTDGKQPRLSRRDAMGTSSPIAAYEPARRSTAAQAAAVQPQGPISSESNRPNPFETNQNERHNQQPRNFEDSSNPPNEPSRRNSPGRYQKHTKEKPMTHSPIRQDSRAVEPKRRESPRRGAFGPPSDSNRDQPKYEPAARQGSSPRRNDPKLRNRELNDIPEQKTYEPVRRESPNREHYHHPFEPQNYSQQRPETPRKVTSNLLDKQPVNAISQSNYYEPSDNTPSPENLRRNDPRTYHTQPRRHEEPQAHESRRQKSPRRDDPSAYERQSRNLEEPDQFYEPRHQDIQQREEPWAYSGHPRNDEEPEVHEPRRQESPRRDMRAYDRQPSNIKPRSQEPHHQKGPEVEDQRQPGNTQPQTYKPRLQESPRRELPQSSNLASQSPRGQSPVRPYETRPQSEGIRNPFTGVDQQEESVQLDPPVNVRARTLADGSVLVEWDTPQLDQLDRNRGIVVAGYKVFINDIEEQSVGSSRLTKSLVSRGIGLPVARVGVQSFGYDGEVSRMAQLDTKAEQSQQQQQQPTPPTVSALQPHWQTQSLPENDKEKQFGPEPVVRERTQPTHHQAPSQQQQQEQQQQQQPEPRSKDPPPDAHSVTPQPFVRKALYDYQPGLNSPSAFPSYELELHRGDDVTTFGPVRPDGMYNAEVNGKRGLVPAQYLQLE